AVDDDTVGAGEDGWASRRQALLEFELRRSPEEPDGVIAKRANCSTGHVRKIRDELEHAGNRKRAAQLRVGFPAGRRRAQVAFATRTLPSRVAWRRERGTQIRRSESSE